MKKNPVNRNLYIVSKLSHPVRVKTFSASAPWQPTYKSSSPCMEFLQVVYVRPVARSHTVRPYVTGGIITFVKKSSNCFRGRNRMRRSKLNLDANDFATFAAWSVQDNLLLDLLSTYTPRSLSKVVHFMMLLPKRRAWIRPVNVDCRWIIIALHFFWVCNIKFVSHYFWSSARTLLVWLLANPSFMRYSILLCRLHTDECPQSVVILRGRL